MRATVVSLLALAVFGCLTGLDTSPSLELDQVGRIVAAEWDRTNGSPVEVRAAVGCVDYWQECSPALATQAPSFEVAAMVAAFSDELAIPSVDISPEDPSAICEWSEVSADAKGLRVEFLEPQVLGDSARVIVYSRCLAPDRGVLASFMQAHEFEFRRGATGAWEFVSRELVLIT